ncbi:MAG: hypothetical protein RLZZ383_1303 [Pseudomonadota bacterium]|jgi:hypothetical protein
MRTPFLGTLLFCLLAARSAQAGSAPLDTIAALTASKGPEAAEAWALRWLKTHEGEPDAQQVARWLDEARWAHASRANTPEAYQTYRALHPAGAFVAAAREAEGQLRCPPVLQARNVRVARELRRELPGTACADALLAHEQDLMWAEAEHDDVPARWDALLTDYPQHPRSDEARFRRTASIDTEQAWTVYLEAAPEGPYAAAARAAAARAGCRAWLDPETPPTLASLAALRARYPSLPCETSLAEIEAILTWTDAAAKNTPEAWTDLLRRFPAHPRAADAATRRSGLWWADAQRLDTEAAYADLLVKDPASPHRAAIEAKLLERATAAAAASGTAAAWRALAERFASHGIAETARRRADVLERREALTAGDSLTLRLHAAHPEDGSLWLDRTSVPLAATPNTEPTPATEAPEPPEPLRPAETTWTLRDTGAEPVTLTLAAAVDGAARLTVRLGDAGPRREVAFLAVQDTADGCGHDSGVVWTTIDGALVVDLATHPRCQGPFRAARLTATTDGWRFEGSLLPGLAGP